MRCAYSTPTRGSGEENGNLATSVGAIELVTANGDIANLSWESEDSRGAAVGLGAPGVITRITLNMEPTYSVRQYVYENRPLAGMKDHFDEPSAADTASVCSPA